MRTNIQIYAMKTWGELGNLLAARTLGETVAAQLPDCGIDVCEIEKFFPRFAATGEKIERLARTPLEPSQRRARYLPLMDELAETFEDEFEAAQALNESLVLEMRELVEHFRRTRPDLVVGTKGIISRLCMTALRSSGLKTTVVNFVTNEGLLRLRLHRSKHLPHNLVPFESARRYLIEEHGFDPRRVQTVGRLIAQPQLGQLLEGQQPKTSADGEAEGDSLSPALPEVRMIVFSNRGGDAYLQLLAHLSERHADMELIFVGFNDPPLVEAANRLRQEKRMIRWRVFDRLAQGDYLRYLNWLREARYPLLVSKTGPNTMLEAAYFGIPQLLLDSGLPMEEWVGPFASEKGIGQSHETMAQLLLTLDQWLAHPHLILERRECALEFGRTMMNQERTKERLGKVFREVIADGKVSNRCLLVEG